MNHQNLDISYNRAQLTRCFAHLHDQREWMKAVVAHHLGLKSSDEYYVAGVSSWLHGSFNVCIPIIVKSWKGKRVLLRFPLPYRVGESFRPGNCDEKVQCKAGAYAWIQNNCSDVPIPKIYGFALSSGETFTRLESLSFISRCFQLLRQSILSLLNGSVPSNYAHHQSRCSIFTGSTMKVGYLLIEFIEETRGKTFFHDLSRIFLNITRFPLPRVGSFVIDMNGSLRLTNRPLSVEIQQLENENIPTEISRDYTYLTADSYITDLSVLTAMRTIFHSIFDRGFRRGPFVFDFTDIHQSNIFVDAEWHITCLVDLEWACTQPIEMLGPLSWLSDKAPVDPGPLRPRLTNLMERSWEKGAFWYSLALSSPSGLFTIFTKHIKPLFCKEFDEEFEVVMPFFFEKNIGNIAGRKLADKKAYDKDLWQAFNEN
ncbi:hypothetical protein P168DRAFT_297150 [Aspergillus campestris IBT 28561]|uniref:Aminoglycoside phosphotransferase domain-containing protein n=1 Tax=Aspergillus campestris (strain IBT 28561) TaxID=1392248 RepID=A0A2I1D306_ASPC2|nr:uncharacterized protein P168DRAFT_297150 [Aspergillus campestris IBT 28561]PKY04249.1 hypothetical protein P168DRAFT_297150 [Aspergillus campestris IBT 28561]